MTLSGHVTVLNLEKRTQWGGHTIRRKLAAGRIKGTKVGRDWFIPEDEAERLEREYPLQELAHAK